MEHIRVLSSATTPNMNPEEAEAYGASLEKYFEVGITSTFPALGNMSTSLVLDRTDQKQKHRDKN